MQVKVCTSACGHAGYAQVPSLFPSETSPLSLGTDGLALASSRTLAGSYGCYSVVLRVGRGQRASDWLVQPNHEGRYWDVLRDVGLEPLPIFLGPCLVGSPEYLMLCSWTIDLLIPIYLSTAELDFPNEKPQTTKLPSPSLSMSLCFKELLCVSNFMGRPRAILTGSV